MKNILQMVLLLVSGISLSGYLQAQPLLTLEEANEKAAKNYPLIRQKQLVHQTSSLNVNNLGKAWLPQISLNAQATYQSAVTEVPIKMQGVFIEPLSKDQYRVMLDINQVIYDGGMVKQQSILQHWNEKVETQKVEVELQKLEERINQIYFSALLAEEQMKLTQIIEKDLRSGISKVEAQVENGTAFRSALAVLQAELLKNNQRYAEWVSAREGLLAVLSEFTGEILPEHTKLQWPDPADTETDTIIRREELTLIGYQDSLLLQQSRLVNVRNRPRLSAFIQGGYGKPGLNMLKNSFDPFYTTGLRINWTIGNLYTAKQDKQIIDINRENLDVQKEYFLLNTRAQMKQQEAEIRKYYSLLQTDEEIIRLKTMIKESSQAQLENGVINSSDFIRDVNAEDQARLSMLIHRLQLIQARLNYKTIVGQKQRKQ